jgi:tricorn protease
MTRLTRLLSALGLLSVLASAATGQEPIRMARTPDISPDGKLITFSYLGDIWVVETIGGIARPVTVHRAHDFCPVFSPDGRFIAFSSNRHGNYNVFVIPIESGKPRQLTFDSSGDLVTGWSPDGKQVLFTSAREPDYPPHFDLYSVPVDGGQVRRITTTEAREATFSPDGTRLAYVRGPGSWYRKGYRGSSNDDIWVCNADGTNHRQLTSFNGQDNAPMWSPDGQWIYYVSELFGTPANVVRVPANPPSPGSIAEPKQITFHKDDGVRRARISGNGLWIVYECGPDLWVVSTQDGSGPRKLAIEVHTDDKSNTERLETFHNAGATEFALSANERHIVFAVHGELFRAPVELARSSSTSQKHQRPVRLTTTGADNHGAAWSPDMSKIIFISDRDGQEELYLLEADDPEHPRLIEAHRFKTTKLTSTREPPLGVSFAPDGKRVAFVRAGKLWTMGPDGKDQKVIVDEVRVIDYEWSPDSKWFVFARADGSFASELYLVPATGPTADNPIRNITRYATMNMGVTWSADGKKLAFLSNRRSNGTLYVLPLQKPAAPGMSEKSSSSTPTVEIDWEDLHRRAEPVGNVPADEAAISPDGKRVAFRAARDLFVASTDGKELSRVTSDHSQPMQITWSKRKLFDTYADLIYFRDRKGAIRVVRPGGESKSESPNATLDLNVKMTIRAEEEFSEMFDQSWRYLSAYFYDPKFHGADWDAMRVKYRPLVKHVALKEDLYALIYLMMGELNASHLGVAGSTTPPEEPTADLGLLFDRTYRGKGLKIAEVLKRGPADKRGLNLKPGEFVLSIDGVPLDGGVDVSKQLNGKIDELIALQVSPTPDGDPKTRRRVEILGVGKERIRELMYERWVENNTKRVAELSKGKLGYIHISDMTEEGLDRFVRSLYSDHFDKEAIVLDVRFNGGGYTHDQILGYLGGREHTWFRHRDGGEGLVMRSYDRKWNRPLVLLINNRSYSDAEIFPHAFRTLGLGKLVGQATGGHVIGTVPMRLIDGSTFRIPRTGVFTVKGVNMDKEGVLPDVSLENQPDQLARGQDAQLDRAVSVLLGDVAEWKKKNDSKLAGTPTESKPLTPPVTPTGKPTPMTPVGSPK